MLNFFMRPIKLFIIIYKLLLNIIGQLVIKQLDFLYIIIIFILGIK